MFTSFLYTPGEGATGVKSLLGTKESRNCRSPSLVCLDFTITACGDTSALRGARAVAGSCRLFFFFLLAGVVAY